MPLRVTVAGRSVRSDHLTLGQLLDVEAATGKTWPKINPLACAKDAFALLSVMFQATPHEIRALPGDVSRWVEVVDDDLPEAFRECIPSLGGQSFDSYVVAFADPEGFGWPPDVTRRQRVRDLDLLLAAFEGRKRRR